MSDENKILALAMGITFVLWPIYFIFALKYRKYANAHDRAVIAKRDGFSTVGTCRKLRWIQGDSSMSETTWKTGFWSTTYEYVVGGKSYRKKLMVSTDESPPDEKTLYYLPDNPKKAFTDSQVKRRAERKIGGFACVGVPIIWTILLFHFMRAFIF
jgi:hypothetical protein